MRCSAHMLWSTSPRTSRARWPRVPTEDGVALIQVPVDPGLDTTYETSAPTEADREREYGQDDHVRIYARDIGDRLGEAFEEVEPVDYAARFEPSEQWRMGFVEPADRDGEDIYVCRPQRGGTLTTPPTVRSETVRS